MTLSALIGICWPCLRAGAECQPCRDVVSFISQICQRKGFPNSPPLPRPRGPLLRLLQREGWGERGRSPGGQACWKGTALRPPFPSNSGGAGGVGACCPAHLCTGCGRRRGTVPGGEGVAEEASLLHRASGSWPRGARPLTRGCWDGAVSMCQEPAEGGTGRRGRACPAGPGTDSPRGPLTQCLSGGWRERLKTLFPFVPDAPAYTVLLGSAGEPVGREEVFCMLHTCNIRAYNLARHKRTF